jgi:hypothetical protein
MTALGACGTHLSAIDVSAEHDELSACQSIEAHVDGGIAGALAKACQCDALGVLRRAGEVSTDAGVDGCP